jgi:hypothetical protein
MKAPIAEAIRPSVPARIKNLRCFQTNRSCSTWRARESLGDASGGEIPPPSGWSSASRCGFVAVCVTSLLFSVEAYLGHDFGQNPN